MGYMGYVKYENCDGGKVKRCAELCRGRMLAAVADMFGVLSLADILIVAAMLRGEFSVSIADGFGITPQSLNTHWKNIVKRDTRFRVIASGQIGKGLGPKVRKRETR